MRRDCLASLAGDIGEVEGGRERRVPRESDGVADGWAFILMEASRQ